MVRYIKKKTQKIFIADTSFKTTITVNYNMVDDRESATKGRIQGYDVKRAEYEAMADDFIPG